jgi:hypothetical protein
MTEPSHERGFITDIAPSLEDDFEMDLKSDAARHLASIATDLRYSDREARIGDLQRSWWDWSDQVIVPITPHLDSSINKTPKHAKGNPDSGYEQYAWACLDTPVDNHGIASPLVITLGLQPARPIIDEWKMIAADMNKVASKHYSLMGKVRIEGTAHMPKPAIISLMDAYGVSPSFVGTTRTGFFSKSVPVHEVDYTGLYHAIVKAADWISHISEYSAVNFQLARQDVAPFRVNEGVATSGTVIDPESTSKIPSAFDGLTNGLYVTEKSDSNRRKTRDPISGLVDSLKPKVLRAAATGKIDREQAISLLKKAAKPAKKTLEQQAETANRVLELLIASQSFKELIGAA